MLKPAPVVLDHSEESGLRDAWDWPRNLIQYAHVQLPRAMSNQIQMTIQQRCGELEEELLSYLQRSVFDPKRRKANALPNHLVLILLLSTYSFVGVKSWVGLYVRKTASLLKPM